MFGWPTFKAFGKKMHEGFKLHIETTAMQIFIIAYNFSEYTTQVVMLPPNCQLMQFIIIK